MSEPTDDSVIDHLQAFCERVHRELYSGRREDLEVRIEIQVNLMKKFLKISEE